MHRSLIRSLIPCLFLLTFVFSPVAVSHTVVINGTLLGPVDIAVFQWIHGEYITDGRYWLNLSTGVWAYEGGGPMGVIGEDNSGSAQGCGGGFAYNSKHDRSCAENPGIC